jgi:hypothetical protein
VTEKTCSLCGETKPLTEFHRSARGAGGVRSQCKECHLAYVKSRYVPRVHPPERVVCPECGEEFTRIRTKGALRIYCTRKCTMAAGEARKLQRNAGLDARRYPVERHGHVGFSIPALGSVIISGRVPHDSLAERGRAGDCEVSPDGAVRGAASGHRGTSASLPRHQHEARSPT